MKVRSLDKKWKEFLYAFTGFGPNFLMVLMGAYFTDAINPAALGDGSFQAIMSGTCFILPAVFPILYAIAKAFDGIIDIPFAYITDTLSTKWGRRRPTILVCMIPMIISFAMCWLPVFGADNQLGNTIWIVAWALVFFSTYTMCLISFYGSLSTTCSDEPQRLRVSGYKSFFDTISYCLVYALVPLLLQVFKINIDKFVFICLPLMLTITIPLFLIKEGEKYGYPENEGMKPEKISMWQSLKLTFTNRLFMKWILVNGCTYFGLQMFLVGMNAMIIGGMGLSSGQMAIVNTCAFAPVPIMLYLFNKVKAKKGIRFTYQLCLATFAIAIFSFFFGSTYIMGDNTTAKIIIGAVGGVFASWAIGAFFMMPLLIPAQISSVEERLTGTNHSAMYFAAQALISSIVSSISGSLVYESIKMLFISKDAGGIKWAESFADAAEAFGVSEDRVFNLGIMLIPFIVSFFCILGIIIAAKWPKNFSHKEVARELKKQDPTLDISEIEAEPDEFEVEDKGEIIFVQIGLWVLSGSIFGFIWSAYLYRAVKEFKNGFKNILAWALSAFVPFVGIAFMLKSHKAMEEKAAELGVKLINAKALYVITGILLPLLPVNFLGLAVMQANANRLYKSLAKTKETVAK
ncbi:MAG: MFS transporter [Clostridia bacterium]|nr:MFS transporter [Clostridia bacterium]